jgi:tRNA A37 N6-isopentenylltransferase MiaA
LGKFPEIEEKIREDLEIEFFWINLDKEEQEKKIRENFLKRIDNGFFKEAEKLEKIIYQYLLKYWYKKVFYLFYKKSIKKEIENKFFDLGLSYKNIFKFWKGEIDKKKFIELGILEEKKYAKRQNTYLKKLFNKLPENKFLIKEKI